MLSRNAKRTLLGISVAVVAVVLFAATIRHYFEARALAIRLEEERADLTPAPPLIVEVERKDFVRERTYAVRLAPNRRTRIAAETAGRVAEVHFEMGDEVAEGERLIELDDTLARFNLEAAEAAIESAEAQQEELRRRLREAEALAETRAIPETQLEAARSQLTVQTSEISRLRAERNRQHELLRRHQVHAPFAGIIDQRLIEPGDTVNINEPIATLATLETLRARFHVSDLELEAFHPGQEIAIRLNAGNEKSIPAKITTISRTADPVTGLFSLEAWAPNPGNRLPSGLQGVANVEIHRYRDTLFVPASAIRFEGPNALATVLRNDERHTQRIQLGPELDGYYPVIAGLNEGEQVVIE